MATVIDKVIEKLQEARSAATLENAGFGFPEDRIEIKFVQFPDEDRGRTGDVIHPTTYVRNIVRLYHHSWIIGPINSAIELLTLHAKTLEASETLIKELEKLDVAGIVYRAKAGIDDPS